MGLLDRIRRRAAAARPVVTEAVRPLRSGRASSRREPPLDADLEYKLRKRLHSDPNDPQAFRQLADIVRRRAAEHVEALPGADPQRAADDANWALAEEMAGNSHAWYPLVELGRLSVRDDREGALRRLSTAAERDPSGRALAEGVGVLRDAGMPDEALGLGVGHWRPREHDVEAGRQLVAAAVAAGRLGEARRHLEALGDHPDTGRVAGVRRQLEREIAAADQARQRQRVQGP